MKEHVCKGEHSGHLCVLVSQGQFQAVMQLAHAPRFICFNCGRVADCDVNLCNPMPIDP